MDEPTAGLDPEASLLVREMIVKLKSEGRTIIVCTHNLDETERLADIVGIIRRRLLICDSLPNLQSGKGNGAQVEIEVGEPPVNTESLVTNLPFVKSAKDTTAPSLLKLRTISVGAERRRLSNQVEIVIF